MLLVNDPGSWSAIFPPLRHAAWNGWTPTDLIFPFFLFIVGITTTLSLEARRARGDSDGVLVRQILRRAGIIVALGLLISWFPFFTWDKVPSVADPTLWQRITDRLLHVRIPGVLQRIGIVYGITALLALRTTARQQLGITIAILLGYWLLLGLFPTLPSATDRALLEWGPYGNHLWSETKTWDPEGPLSTLPAIATALLGVLAGRHLRSPAPLSEKLNTLFVTGAVGTVLGLVWNWFFPINKNLWTSSYVVFTAGVACLTLAVCEYVVAFTSRSEGTNNHFPLPASGEGVRGRGARKSTGPAWATPFVVFGVNPTIAFVGAEVMARLIYSVVRIHTPSGTFPIETVMYRAAFASWLPPKVASLAFAMSFVGLWLGVLTVLYRRRIFLKV